MSDPKKIETFEEAVHAAWDVIKLLQRLTINTKEFKPGGLVSDQPARTSAMVSKEEKVIQRDPKNHV
jgi:hypothetical protein